MSGAGGGPLPIGVIGAGFSGTMAAIQLLAQLPSPQTVLLCDRADVFGRGLAYSTPNPVHLLNVRAANMSAYPDQPDHFANWLESLSPEDQATLVRSTSGVFAPRSLYGRYLAAELMSAMTPDTGTPRLMLSADEVVDLTAEAEPGTYRLHMAGGRHYKVAGVVLALGNLRSVHRPDSVRYSDPWAPQAMEGLSDALPVLIIGSGLTMVDAVLTLRRQGFGGRIVAVSRRGLLPQAHAPAPAWKVAPIDNADRRSIARLLRRLRRDAEAAQAAESDWRAVIDALRSITRSLWQGLPPSEQGRFLRHLRPYWDVHRHRMAPPAAEAIAAMLKDGSLTLRRGRITEVADGPGHAIVSIRLRGGEAMRLDVQRVIDASGVESISKVDDPLVDRLMARGLARLDGLGIGLDVTDNLDVVGADGALRQNLWALGPIVRGRFWECTAVPDIRSQAADLAQHVSASFTHQYAI